MNAVCFSPDGSLLASCSNKVLVFEVGSGTLRMQLGSEEEEVFDVLFKDQHLFVASNSIKEWDLLSK